MSEDAIWNWGVVTVQGSFRFPLFYSFFPFLFLQFNFKPSLLCSSEHYCLRKFFVELQLQLLVNNNNSSTMSFEDLESGRKLRSIPRPTPPQKEDPSIALVALLFKINTSVYAFQRQVNAIGTPKDTSLFRSNL